MGNIITKSRFKAILRRYFDLRGDKDDESTVFEDIKQGVSFRGANLWILILAIFVASLGLNVNSTAVIIGAMLISPLMGPIIGIGYSIGTIDMELLKRSFKNYLIATVFSIITATAYWFISPFDEPQSELIARTTPTLYDVLIAFCGGAAGIIATCTKGKGNVIPGVAIATALMPPLCTAGYGIATLQMNFFFGAFYLYFINSVFICMATIIGVRIMKFAQKTQVDKSRFINIRRKFYIIIGITMVPAAIMTVNIVNDSILKRNLNKFIHDNLSTNTTKIISQEIIKDNHTVRLIAVGKEITNSEITDFKAKMKDYKLGKYSLEIIQGATSDSIVSSDNNIIDVNQALKQQTEQIAVLEERLQQYNKYNDIVENISKELKVVNPKVNSLSIGNIPNSGKNTSSKSNRLTAVIYVQKDKSLSEDERFQITEWLKVRTEDQNIKTYFDFEK